MYALTSRAMIRSFLQLLHLVVFQIDRDGPAEDGQLDLDLALVLLGLLDHAVHAVERAIDHADALAVLEPLRPRRDRLVLAGLAGLADHPLDLARGHRRGGAGQVAG